MPEKDTTKKSTKKVAKKTAKKMTKKAAPKKSSGRKPASPKRSGERARVKKAEGQERAALLTQEERHQMISLAAYYLSLSPELQRASPEGNWLAAEAEVDAELSARGIVPGA
ncbi:MAG: hypothetical protein VX834_10275 [Myxococcota bacterium]|nr:hypothetical protein [Myxococcota bacterium]